ncbi:MAG: hypothetical protein KBE22_09995 [Candidatus Accumulibacter sp.]|nr:hypothetical protein [Accumulibacter sp.]
MSFSRHHLRTTGPKSALAAVPLLAGQYLIVVNGLTSDNFSPPSEKSVAQTIACGPEKVESPVRALDRYARPGEYRAASARIYGLLLSGSLADRLPGCAAKSAARRF